MAKKESSTLPSVLAFEKKIVPSDGLMYGTIWESRYTFSEPLNLSTKSVRGTISNRLKPAIKNDPLKLNAEVEKANLQTVDSCSLGSDQDTLRLFFTLKFLSGVENPSACNNSEFLKTYKEAVNNYINEESFTELGLRYAINIANGRYLWRNRIGAEKIEIRVKATGIIGKEWIFNGLEVSLTDFSIDNPEIIELGNFIAETLSGTRDFLMLEIDTFVLMGKAQDVYPSEELVLDKGKGEKSKVLYSNNSIAGMHSQKIGNALRSIDTWYPGFGLYKKPIAIEPYGAVTNLGKAFRNPKENSDFYTLFDLFATGGKLENKEDEHFVMSVLIRGGVFGESSKE